MRVGTPTSSTEAWIEPRAGPDWSLGPDRPSSRARSPDRRRSLGEREVEPCVVLGHHPVLVGTGRTGDARARCPARSPRPRRRAARLQDAGSAPATAASRPRPAPSGHAPAGAAPASARGPRRSPRSANATTNEIPHTPVTEASGRSSGLSCWVVPEGPPGVATDGQEPADQLHHRPPRGHGQRRAHRPLRSPTAPAPGTRSRRRTGRTAGRAGATPPSPATRTQDDTSAEVGDRRRPSRRRAPPGAAVRERPR